MVVFDPLDGSSNIDVNVNVGTIFSIHKRESGKKGDPGLEDILRPGDRLIFLDMAHYTMVKTTTFNGLCLPAIYLAKQDTHELHTVRTFGYKDFKMRL